MHDLHLTLGKPSGLWQLQHFLLFLAETDSRSELCDFTVWMSQILQILCCSMNKNCFSISLEGLGVFLPLLAMDQQLHSCEVAPNITVCFSHHSGCHLLNTDMILTHRAPNCPVCRTLWHWSLLSPHLMLHSSFFSAQPAPAFRPSWLAVCQKGCCLPPEWFSVVSRDQNGDKGQEQKCN